MTQLTTHVLILAALDERAAYGPDADVPLREIHAYLAARDEAPQYTAPETFNDERMGLHRTHLPKMKKQGLIKSEGSGHHWYLTSAGRNVLSMLRG